jgi:hypothetical protein
MFLRNVGDQMLVPQPSTVVRTPDGKTIEVGIMGVKVSLVCHCPTASNKATPPYSSKFPAAHTG